MQCPDHRLMIEKKTKISVTLSSSEDNVKTKAGAHESSKATVLRIMFNHELWLIFVLML